MTLYGTLSNYLANTFITRPFFMSTSPCHVGTGVRSNGGMPMYVALDRKYEHKRETPNSTLRTEGIMVPVRLQLVKTTVLLTRPNAERCKSSPRTVTESLIHPFGYCRTDRLR
jgi:hypothetical protein